MEPAAHLPQTRLGADQGRLRRTENPAGLQGPGEMVGVDAHHQPGVLKLAGLHRRLEIAAVEQHGPIAQAVVLIGLPVAEDHEGVVLVAGGAPDASGALDAGAQGGAAGTALHQMRAVESDHIQIGAREIQAQGGAPAQTDRALSHVPH